MDSDYANDIDDRKNTSGYVFMMSEIPISWSSKKPPRISLSTTKVKFKQVLQLSTMTI